MIYIFSLWDTKALNNKINVICFKTFNSFLTFTYFNKFSYHSYIIIYTFPLNWPLVTHIIKQVWQFHVIPKLWHGVFLWRISQIVWLAEFSMALHQTEQQWYYHVSLDALYKGTGELFSMLHKGFQPLYHSDPTVKHHKKSNNTVWTVCISHHN